MSEINEVSYEERRKWYIDFLSRSRKTLDEENSLFINDKEVMGLVVKVNPELITKLQLPKEWLDDFSFVAPVITNIHNQAVYETILPYLGQNVKSFIRAISERAIITVENTLTQKMIDGMPKPVGEVKKYDEQKAEIDEIIQKSTDDVNKYLEENDDTGR